MKADGQWVAAGLAVALCVGTASAAWSNAFAHKHAQMTREALCADYRAFTGAILHSGILADAGVRMTAARLQQAAERFPSAPQPESVPAHDAASALRLLLRAPYATRTDLFVSARPIAVACGLDWRNGSSWEYAPGS